MSIPANISGALRLSTGIHPALKLCALLLLVAFAFQGSRPLYDSDEGRYTNVALNMLDSGDFLVPHLDPDHPHYAKPPLTYWTLAASFRLFGTNVWAARVPSALAFVGVGLLIAWMARRVGLRHFRRAGMLWALTLAPVIGSNVVSTDILLTFFEALAAACFLAAETAPRPIDAGRWRVGMWCAFGLAFLVKGPPGLVPLAAMGAALAYQHGWHGLRRLGSAMGLPLGLALALSWYVYVCAHQPGLLQYLVGHEVVDRLATAVHDRNPGVAGLLQAYLPMLLAGTLPWSLLWLDRRVRRAPPVPGDDARCAWLLAIWWCGLGAAIFGLAQSRLPLYVLPLFVPYCLWLAVRLDHVTNLFDRRGMRRAAAWLVLVLCLKELGGLVHTSHDGDAFAAQLAKLTRGQAVTEWIFVDGEPHFDLRLYTGRTTRIASLEKPAPAFSTRQRLCDVVGRSPHPVLLTGRHEAAHLARELLLCPNEFVERGSAGRYAVFVGGTRPRAARLTYASRGDRSGH